MTLLHTLTLLPKQGFAEQLPISCSANLITSEKLMGLASTIPEMTLLLVMLLTCTMFAVKVYSWKAWKTAYFSSVAALNQPVDLPVIATAVNGVVGFSRVPLKTHHFAATASKAEIENLFGNSRLMTASRAVAGFLIIDSLRFREREGPLSKGRTASIGSVQGLCLPICGISR